MLKNKDIPQDKVTVMRLISEINQSEFDVSALEKLISRDVAISYKLLKYLNSAYFSRLAPLKSIRQAVAFLGERGVKLFVSLIATSQLAENKPDELVRLAIIRARFLEQLGKHLNVDSGELFLLGLFSLIDAMLDNSMDYLVTRLPVSEAIRQALVERTGPLAGALRLVESYERADWRTVEHWREHFMLDEQQLMSM
ncbi:MAG: HDOD domain-containing protein, partial [Desulfofustis sp.]|nr:HDOD domain-containing protein [Desulfofustis sp.]